MSRPFSYNDENFTVINNILFVHLNVGKGTYVRDSALITIPPKIFDRMVTYNQYCYGSTKEYNNEGYNLYLKADENGIFRNVPDIPESSTDKVIYTWFLLKDI